MNATFHTEPVLDVIMQRKAHALFSDKPIETEKINALFEAARWTPSSNNEQPWQYIYATHDNPELYTKIMDTLNAGNRVWAGNAPLLIVSLARKNHLERGTHNASALHDTGMANYGLCLQATAMGLFTRMMGGFNHETLKTNLNVPDTTTAVVVIAVGYPGDKEGLPEPLKQKEDAERKRSPLSSFVFTDTQHL